MIVTYSLSARHDTITETERHGRQTQFRFDRTATEKVRDFLGAHVTRVFVLEDGTGTDWRYNPYIVQSCNDGDYRHLYTASAVERYHPINVIPPQGGVLLDQSGSVAPDAEEPDSRPEEAGSYRYTFDGSLSQMGSQASFLSRRGFRIGYRDVYPAVASEAEWNRAVAAIWAHSVDGWWHYKQALIAMGACTEDEFRAKLHR